MVSQVNSLVGFTLASGIEENDLGVAISAQRRALARHGHLNSISLRLGETILEVWGHGKLEERIHYLPEGGVLVLVGSPHNRIPWSLVEEKVGRGSGAENFEFPWDGRVILLQISADGRQWKMWNDWVGSIPVFHITHGRWRVASTLEPVTVAAGALGAKDIYLPGLVAMLINGHLLSDWTLFKQMKVVPPDCMAEWDANGFRSTQLWTVKPSRDRWETGWYELIDEMFELTYQAIGSALETHTEWIIPLSSGLDSRLIAAVGSKLNNVRLHAYSWGAPDATDVIYAKQVARTLGLPWKLIDIGADYLVEYTPAWADMFGSSMHFHGMYQMAFLDKLQSGPYGPVVSGYMGDVLAGEDINDLTPIHATGHSYGLFVEGYIFWEPEEIERLIDTPVKDALEEVASAYQSQIESVPGAWFQQLMFLGIWARQHHFTYFHSTLCDYWRGVATPFLNRTYAQFCFSLPRIALDHRRLLKALYCKHYQRLARIPGSYADDPLILTGRHLLKRRSASIFPSPLRHRLFKGLEFNPLRLDIDCVHTVGKDAFWPVFNSWDKLRDWVDINQVNRVLDQAMRNGDDYKLIRKLQSIQALSYRLVDNLEA